jgi:hypothetical protein
MDIYARPSLKPRQKAVYRKSPAMPPRIHGLIFDQTSSWRLESWGNVAIKVVFVAVNKQRDPTMLESGGARTS